MSVILKAENISKQYRLGTVGTGTLSHDLNRWWHSIRGKEDPYLKIGGVNDRSLKASEDYVWALKDINFEVNQGEVLGIIGKNGAGKSTLLKILSRVTAPSTGIIKTKGRIASLLEVGTGFHPELTGRENIYLNGAILGMTKSEITSKLDEIIDFSGCEMYIDTPVKRYSSGMTVRLAFAVAAHLEPEILVIDEVLAVGDAEFQRKAIGKMQDLSHAQGRTVLFVSHNMASVKKLCTRVIILSNGSIAYSGDTIEAIEYYLKENEISELSGKVNFENNPEFHLAELKLLSVSIEDSKNVYRTTFTQSEKILVKIKFKNFVFIKNLRFNLILETTSGEEVFMTSSHSITEDGVEEGIHTLAVTIPSYLLNERRYIIKINAGIPGVKYFFKPFKVSGIDLIGENAGGSTFVEKWPGVVAPKLKWSYEKN